MPTNTPLASTTPRAKPGRSPHTGAVAACGAMLGGYLIVSSGTFPSGIGSLPGPGFFPLLLGCLLLFFSAMIAWEARRGKLREPKKATSPGAWKRPALAAFLVAGWLFAWGSIPFPIRTSLLVFLLLRLGGAAWKGAALAAILLPAVVFAIFQLGLRVDLG